MQETEPGNVWYVYTLTNVRYKCGVHTDICTPHFRDVKVRFNRAMTLLLIQKQVSPVNTGIYTSHSWDAKIRFNRGQTFLFIETLASSVSTDICTSHPWDAKVSFNRAMIHSYLYTWFVLGESVRYTPTFAFRKGHAFTVCLLSAPTTADLWLNQHEDLSADPWKSWIDREYHCAVKADFGISGMWGTYVSTHRRC